MGGKQSKSRGRRQLGAGDDLYGGTTPEYQPSSISRDTHRPTPAYQPSSISRHTHPPTREEAWFPDTYDSDYEGPDTLAKPGLKDLNIIMGIDFSRSNEQTGMVHSFGSRYDVNYEQNPSEQEISIICETLSTFGEDNPVPCFGFGDESTTDKEVFSFFSDERSCQGFSEVLDRYRELNELLKDEAFMARTSPTSFAPIIEMAMTTVHRSGGQYHVLLIISHEQVVRSSQEQKTIDAIVSASRLPLSIVLIGVGDGPWDMMERFADKIPTRDFDNFHFLNFRKITFKNMRKPMKIAAFALAVAKEIRQQYATIRELRLFGCPRIPRRPPTTRTNDSTVQGFRDLQQSRKEAALTELLTRMGDHPRDLMEERREYESYEEVPPNYDNFSDGSERGSLCLHCGAGPRRSPSPTVEVENANSNEENANSNEICGLCAANPKDMAFGCGHLTCCDCGRKILNCPTCREPIATRIRLYLSA